MASLQIRPVSRLQARAEGPLSGRSELWRGDYIFRWQGHTVPWLRTCRQAMDDSWEHDQCPAEEVLDPEVEV